MRLMRWMAAAAIAAGIFAGSRVALADEPPAKDLAPAMRAAEAWLALLDTGRYGESWDAAARVFQESIPRLKWEVMVQDVRENVGGLGARKLRSANYTTALPGAPEGEYVVIQYGTQFERRALSIETVSAMLGKDGTWKVSGYFIR